LQKAKEAMLEAITSNPQSVKNPHVAQTLVFGLLKTSKTVKDAREVVDARMAAGLPVLPSSFSFLAVTYFEHGNEEALLSLIDSQRQSAELPRLLECYVRYCSRFKHPDEAVRFLIEAKEEYGVDPTITGWASAMMGYLMANQPAKARDTLQLMEKLGVPKNELLVNVSSLVLAKLNMLELAEKLLIANKHVLSERSFNAVVRAYGRKLDFDGLSRIWQLMKEVGLKPSSKHWLWRLSAAWRLGTRDQEYARMLTSGCNTSREIESIMSRPLFQPHNAKADQPKKPRADSANELDDSEELDDLAYELDQLRAVP